MTSPPRTAAWLVALFVPDHESDSMLGDLHEEFLHLSSQSGHAAARSWYRRQSLKTVVHLCAAGFRNAPWTTTAAVFLGYALLRLLGHLPESALFALLDHYRAFDHHFSLAMLLLPYGLELGRLLLLTVIGAVMALASNRRELIAVVALALILQTLALIGWCVTLASTADASILWQAPWSVAGSFALVVGAIMVRRRRGLRAPVLP